MTLLFFFVAQFPLNLALLVGALTMITGPTVINPCVRQLGIKEEVGFTLEGEGLVNDALGVIIASVIFSAILAETVGSVFILPLQIIYNLSIGILAGLTISGLGIFISIYVAPRFFASLGDRCDEVNRAQLTRIAMLIAAFSAYGLAEFFAPEAGIVSVLIAGILIGNRDRFSPEDVDTWDEEAAPQTLKDHIEAGVHAFQSDLVKLAIATVFILLTTVVTRELLLSALVFASVPFAGLIIVTALILVVRPLGVVVSTIGTSFTWRERLFMSFFGPRGIVIAAAGVFFYLELLAYGISFEMIPAYIFLIVFATVVIQAGLSPYTARACKVCVRD